MVVRDLQHVAITDVFVAELRCAVVRCHRTRGDMHAGVRVLKVVVCGAPPVAVRVVHVKREALVACRLQGRLRRRGVAVALCVCDGTRVGTVAVTRCVHVGAVIEAPHDLLPILLVRHIEVQRTTLVVAEAHGLRRRLRRWARARGDQVLVAVVERP